jgi:PAS domain S-box-containing protein
MNREDRGIPEADHLSAITDYLAGGGEMAQLVRSKDWSTTPLGPIESWPQSLRTTISLCLASNFPIDIIWGPEHTQIYNDGYRVVCGDAHPAALGEGYDVTWASAWPAIGEPFARALAGETSYLENQRMFLTRNGYLEETFFTFSTSPIRDESGGIGGLFHPVAETTATMLSERRTRAVRDLVANLGAVTELSELPSATVRTLSHFAFDLPFVLFYEVSADSTHYILKDHNGIQPDGPISPAKLAATADAPWPICQAAAHAGVTEINNLAGLIGGTACGPYAEAPNHAFLLPITLPGIDQPPIIMILGASSRLPLNDLYRGFYELLLTAISASLATTRAREDERRQAEALAAIDRAKTAFFSNVSHEFRTPLTLMLGPLEDMLGDVATLSPDRREALAVVHRNALRLLRLVNSLLDFSRIEAGRAQARFEPTQLEAMTLDLVSNFDSACARAGLSLHVDFPKLSQLVYIDRDMWEKIVLNLMSNAFKFTLEGRISVSLHEVGTGVQLAVRDTGVGIPAHELPRVFERFHRIEGQRGRTHEGTGIGLTLVQELVELHGGRIEVDSAEGEGTVFRVTLPFGKAHLPQDRILGTRTIASTAMPARAFVEEALRWLPDALEAEHERGQNGQDPDNAAPTISDLAKIEGKPRVLIADDNADMRGYIRRILENGGYAVEAVDNGADAFAAARLQPPPDLILTDVMMPEMDGFQLLQAIRTDPATKGLLVILLSARAGEEARIEGLAAGADDYLVKPFSTRELRARVDGAVRLARQRNEAAERERDLQTELATAQSRAQLNVAEQRLDLALEAGRLGTWEWDLITGNFTASEIFRDNFGWPLAEPYDHQKVIASVYPDDRSLRQDRVDEAIASRSDLDMEYRVVRPGGEIGWVQIRGHASYAEDGRPLGMTGVSLDISDRKRAEERQRLLLDELNHRVKNTLATVQSIALQTRRTANGPQSFSNAFEARIAALAQAHDLLTRTAWEGTRLSDVVELTLAPYARTDQGGSRVEVVGPAVRLGPNAAVTMGMAFHELATNAAKYGALSINSGHVGVRWSVDRSTGPLTLAIDWTERNGPAVEPPGRQGFGSRLLKSGVPRELGGSVALDFAPQGLVCRMRLDISGKITVLD